MKSTPGMDIDNQVKTDLAAKQWRDLYTIYTEKLGFDVRLLEPVKNLPDMVFTANGGLVIGGRVALPHFRQPDRQPETKYFEQWFKEQGYSSMLEPKYDFEGEGDALVFNNFILAGYPWRSDKPSHREIGQFYGLEVISLQLIDPRFYHLDTCLCVIDQQSVAIYPEAFAASSLDSLKAIVPNLIEAELSDALAYGLNAMSDGQNIVIPKGANGLVAKYQLLGKKVYETDISEFQNPVAG